MDISSLLIVRSQAYDQSQITSQLETFFSKIKSWLTNPDVIWLNLDQQTFTIAQVRSLLQQLAYQTYNQEGRVVVVLAADKSTSAAQNALLKTLEEPPHRTTIVLVVNQPELLLPTVVSRCRVIGPELDQTDPNEKSSLDDLEMSNLYHALTKGQCSPAIELSEKAKQAAEALALVVQLRNWLLRQPKTNSNISNLQILTQAEQTLNQNINPRLTIEHYLFQFQ